MNREDEMSDWTPEKLERIPEVYRDFMLALKPVVDSETQGGPVLVTGVHLGSIFTSLRTRYDYGPGQIRQVADNLKHQDYVEENKFGSFRPTPRGKELIEAIAATLEASEAAESGVPPLPEF